MEKSQYGGTKMPRQARADMVGKRPASGRPPGKKMPASATHRRAGTNTASLEMMLQHMAPKGR